MAVHATGPSYWLKGLVTGPIPLPCYWLLNSQLGSKLGSDVQSAMGSSAAAAAAGAVPQAQAPPEVKDLLDAAK
jgi:hypothetical protein